MKILKHAGKVRCSVVAVAMLFTPVYGFAQNPPRTLDINRFIIQGLSLLKADEYDAVLNQYLGKHRNAADVQHAVEALIKYYRSKGIIIAGIIASEQNYVQGEVTLQIIELRLAHPDGESISLRIDEHFVSRQSQNQIDTGNQAAEVSRVSQTIKDNPDNLLQIQLGYFDINRFMIEGNSLLNSSEITTVLKPFLGKHREASEVDHAVEALRQRYILGGFTIAGIIASEQDYERGSITIQIIESRTGKYTRVGFRQEEEANIRSRLLVVSNEVASEAEAALTKFQIAKEDQAILAKSQPLRFDIHQYKVEGNTLLHPDEIRQLLQPYTGKQREYADVQRAIEALRQCYRDKGYSAVWVVAPEQDIDNGIVTLNVIEAKIGKISVTGNLYFDETNIRASLPALKEGSAPKARDISANTQLANENPVKQVAVVLRSGASPEWVNATVEVVDSNPLNASITLDNTGNAQTGEYRLGVNLQDANLLNYDDVGTLSYVTSPGKWNQVSLYSASYRVPIYLLGDSMDLIAAYSDVNAGTAQTVAGPLSFSGKGTIFSVRYNQLLRRRGDYAHRVIYGLENRAYKNNCTLGSFGSAGCGATASDITVRPLSLAYDGNWSKPGKAADFSVSLARNIPGAANGHASDFNAARPGTTSNNGAPAKYSIWRFGSSVSSSLLVNWQARVAVNAQFTSDALVSGEQFGIAGANAVRGFKEREIARDKGYFVNLELYSPFITASIIPQESSLRGLLFYDLAKAANNPLPGETRQQTSIASAGAGLRWNSRRNFNLRIDMAKIIHQDAGKQPGNVRGNFSIFYSF
jgi:hemolysin activation/secretion protein